MFDGLIVDVGERKSVVVFEVGRDAKTLKRTHISVPAK